MRAKSDGHPVFLILIISEDDKNIGLTGADSGREKRKERESPQDEAQAGGGAFHDGSSVTTESQNTDGHVGTDMSPISSPTSLAWAVSQNDIDLTAMFDHERACLG